MSRSLVLFLPAVLAAPLFAQKVEIKVPSGDDQTVRFAIQSKLHLNDSNKTLVNGQEMGGGRGGGGGGGGGGAGSGDRSALQDVVFEQGPASANWRQYTKLQVTETRPGRDGEPAETKVEGALQGKKVFFKTEGGKTTLVEGDGDKQKPVDETVARGVPGRLSLNSLLPTAAIAVGDEFDLGKTFGPAIAAMLHPVTPERQQNAGGGAAGGGDPAGGGGGQGGGRRGGGGGQRQGGGRMGIPVGAMATELLSAGKLDVKANGKLASVEEKDGQKIAVIEFKATMAGKGKAADLGMPPGMAGFGGGRRGGGGAGGGAGGGNADNGTDTVDANFAFTGKMRVNLTQNQIAGLELASDVTIGREIHRTMQMRGEDSKIDSTMNSKGKLEFKVDCEPVKGEKSEKGEAKGEGK
jgi:hypothetical protein